MDLSILPPFAGFFLVDVDFFFAIEGTTVKAETLQYDVSTHTFTTLLFCHPFMESLCLILVSKDNPDHTFLHTSIHHLYQSQSSQSSKDKTHVSSERMKIRSVLEVLEPIIELMFPNDPSCARHIYQPQVIHTLFIIMRETDGPL